MRRLSVETVKMYEGTVAKLAHSNPCVFFPLVVQQVTAYENMAGVVITALGYSTNMGFDVLGYTILDALSNPNKERVKSDGVNTADWLQGTCLFLSCFSSPIHPF